MLSLLTHRTRVLALVLLMIGALLGVPAAAASASTHHSAARAQGPVRFVIINTDPNDDGGTVGAFGVIHAHGTDTQLTPRRDRFEFDNGDVIIRHQITKGSVHRVFDPTSCYFNYRERGTWRAADGTDDYDNIEGNGKYTLFVEGFGCNPNDTPDVLYSVVNATGRVNF